MNIEAIKAYCLAQTGSVESSPMGEWPICYEVGGRMFAQVYPDVITLRCTIFYGETLRNARPEIIAPNRLSPTFSNSNWFTIDLSRIPPKDLAHMINLAYQTVVQALPKAEQLALQEGESL